VGYNCNSNSFNSNGSQLLWASYTFRSTASANLAVSLGGIIASSGTKISVYIDGKLISAQTVTSGFAALSFDAGVVSPGLHGVVVSAVSGSFSIGKVSVQ